MKRAIAALLSVVVGVGMLGGCAKNTPSSSSSNTAGTASQSSASSSAGRVTLRTVSMFGGTDPSAAVYNQNIVKFESENNVTVKDASATSDQTWKAQVVNDFNSGSEADVTFFFTGSDASTIVSSGQVVDLATIQAAYPDYAKNIKSSVMDQIKASDGKAYAVPVRGYWEGIFCNKDMFDKYQLQLPTTWDNLTKAVTTFHSKGVIPFAASLADVPHYFIEHFILAEGGVKDHSVNPGTDMSKVPASWTTGLGLFKTFADMGAFPSNYASSKDAEIQQLFINKKAAMRVDGSWFAGSVTDAANTTVVPFPAAPGSSKDPSDIISGFSSGFYISKKAWDDPAKRDAAVKFIMLMTSNDSIKAFVDAAGGSPASEVTPDSSLSALAKAGIQMASDAKSVDAATDSRLSQACYTSLVNNMASVAAGKMTAADALKTAIALNTSN